MNDAHCDDKSLAAIILAAGEGYRFGKPKWQGEYQSKTFLEIIKEKLFLADFSDIICVKQESFDIRFDGLLYVDTPTPQFGMISSLYYALKSHPNYKGYLVIPVDHPLVELFTIKELKRVFKFDKQQIIRPVYNCVPGHPIIIPGSFISFLKTPDYPGGLRQLIKDSKTPITDISINDPNILKNVNIQSDLRD